MKKRAYPFESDIGRQLKVHVGQKQVDSGVLKKQQMQIVYDRTMNLLKEGAKNQSLDTSADNLKLNTLNSCIKCKSAEVTKMKQTFLNNKLQIENTGREFHCQDIGIVLCGCCRIIDSQSKCNRCDQILCTSCLSECVFCQRTFCQNCFMLMCDNGERCICMDCYR